MPLNNSDSHSTHPKVVNAPSITWACRILFSSAGVQPEPAATRLSALSAKSNSSCRFSPIHSASFVGSQRRAGWAVRYTYSNYVGEDSFPSGTVKGCSGSCRNSILLGLRRLRSRRTRPEEFIELACTPQSISRYIRILDEYILILDEVSYDNSPPVATSFLDGAAWT